ncbi:hypothetical protein H4R34_004648 [Dimargaris verticillata]|uniref:Uncharacterized protein n=1 Tax=Dimargaris verticillata TaxID=2761393 RepID=A0A9W8AYH3_9FUNG|nr:hypothetical protein H4R34_004648 [Dimargaris verticillata]
MQYGHVALEHKAKASAASPADFNWYRYRDIIEAQGKPYNPLEIYQALLSDPQRYHIHSYRKANPVHHQVLKHLNIHSPFGGDDSGLNTAAVDKEYYGHGHPPIYDEPESYA